MAYLRPDEVDGDICNCVAALGDLRLRPPEPPLRFVGDDPIFLLTGLFRAPGPEGLLAVPSLASRWSFCQFSN